MNSIDKFISDIQKTIKYDRANNGGHYDAKRACTQIAKLFSNNNKHLGTLAVSLGDYWLNTYILASGNLENEPSDTNIERLKAFQSFIDNETEHLRLKGNIKIRTEKFLIRAVNCVSSYLHHPMNVSKLDYYDAVSMSDLAAKEIQLPDIVPNAELLYGSPAVSTKSKI